MPFIETKKLSDGCSFLPLPKYEDVQHLTKWDIKLFPYPPDSLVSVSFGWRTLPQTKREVVNALLKNELGHVILYDGKA